MKSWNLWAAVLGGVLLAGCASDDHSAGNSGNLDLPTPATTSAGGATVTTLSGPSNSATGSATAADQAVSTGSATATGSVSVPDAVTPSPTGVSEHPTSSASTGTATASINTTSYTVVEGDSLWKIAHKLKTSVNTLKALNGITNNLIHPGQVLKVPAS